MPKFSYDPHSFCVDYEADRSEDISSEEAQAMALVDIANSLKRIAFSSEEMRDNLNDISEDVAGIRNGAD